MRCAGSAFKMAAKRLSDCGASIRVTGVTMNALCGQSPLVTSPYRATASGGREGGFIWTPANERFIEKPIPKIGFSFDPREPR